jgi:hypothetical protein
MTRSQKLLSSLGFAGVVSALVAQPACASNIAQVTAVRLNPTSEGIEIILDTEDGRPLQVFSASFGETLQADVITAQLRLPGGNEFRQDKPAAGIASVTVTRLDNNSIRIKVIGERGQPVAQVIPGAAGLILRLKTHLGHDCSHACTASYNTAAGDTRRTLATDRAAGRDTPRTLAADSAATRDARRTLAADSAATWDAPENPCRRQRSHLGHRRTLAAYSAATWTPNRRRQRSH